MSDTLVELDSFGKSHISPSTLNDIIARENVEYLKKFDGVEGLSIKLMTSLENGISQDEEEDEFFMRIKRY